VTTRETNRFDGTLAGAFQFRLVRGEGSYSKVTQRSNLPFNQSEEHQGKFNTRQDIRTMWQTSWGGGALWYQPQISEASIDTFFDSTNMDTVSEPGNVLARPPVTAENVANNSNINVGLQTDIGTIYFFEDNGTDQGLINWASGTPALLTNDFTVDNVDPVAMAWDAANDTVVALFADAKLAYVTPDSAGGLILDLAASVTVNYGANVFFHFGRLLVWDGDKLWEISDPYGTPAIGNSGLPIYDDGMGPDALSNISFASSDQPIPEWGCHTAVSSNEGVWIAKNVEQEGKPTATLTRVDRNTQGTNIGNPVATLPIGKAVLDLSYHLGSVMMSTSSDMVRVFGNDLSSYGHIPIDIHFFTENTGLGTVGSPLGGPDPDDTVFTFMGAQADRMFIGGMNNVYVYDAVRGGLHPWAKETGSTNTFTNVFSTLDGSTEIYLYTRNRDTNFYKQATAFTSDTTDDHTLESNWFDFNIPSEQKTVTHITLITDGIGTNETVTVELQDQEEGGWVTQGIWTSADNNTTKKRVTTASQQTGYRFKYRLTWDISSGTATPPTRIKGITFHAIEGEMVTQWRLQIDGKEFRSIENQVLRSEDVRSALETYAADQTVIVYSDEFRETATTHNVKVEAVQIEGETPEEFVATVVLTEDV